MRAQRAGHTGLYACGPELQARPECRRARQSEGSERERDRDGRRAPTGSVCTATALQLQRLSAVRARDLERPGSKHA